MITIFLTFLKPYWKYIIAIAILISLFFYGRSLYRENIYLKSEQTRQTENLKNKDFQLTIEKTKSGQLAYSVNTLQTQADEIQYYNKSIVDRLNDMGLKIKNLQSVTNIAYHYDGVIDTIKTKMVAPNKFLASWTDKRNLDFVGYINIPKDYPNFTIPSDFSKIDSTTTAKYPYLSNVKVTFNDSLLIAPTYEYKRRWIFWKKLTGVKLHIKSENPNFVLDKIQSFQVDSKNKK